MKAQSVGGSSDGGLEEDEADAQPYSSEQSVRGTSTAAIAGRVGTDHQHGDDIQVGQGAYGYSDERLDTAGWRPSQRPSPGGRFPSDLNVHRGLQAPVSPSSGESSTERDRDAIAAAGALPGSTMPFTQSEAPQQQSTRSAFGLDNEKTTARQAEYGFQDNAAAERGYAKPQQQPPFAPIQQYGQQKEYDQPMRGATQTTQQYVQSSQENQQQQQQLQREYRETPSQFTANSNLPTAAVGLGGAAFGAAAATQHYKQESDPRYEERGSRYQQSDNVTGERGDISTAPQSTSTTTDAATAMSPITSTNTTNNPGPVSSSFGDTAGLSTVPTTMGSIAAAGNNNNNSGFGSSQPQSKTPLPTEQDDRFTATTTETEPQAPSTLGSSVNQDGIATGSGTTSTGVPSAAAAAAAADTKPTPLRSMTGTTISDLHIPGEFPKTPKLAQ